MGRAGGAGAPARQVVQSEQLAHVARLTPHWQSSTAPSPWGPPIVCLARQWRPPRPAWEFPLPGRAGRYRASFRNARSRAGHVGSESELVEDRSQRPGQLREAHRPGRGSLGSPVQVAGAAVVCLVAGVAVPHGYRLSAGRPEDVEPVAHGVAGGVGLHWEREPGVAGVVDLVVAGKEDRTGLALGPARARLPSARSSTPRPRR